MHDNPKTINGDEGARRKQDRRAPFFVAYIQHSSTKKVAYGLRKKRKEIGMTQAELSEITGINRSYISQVESGKQNISIEKAERLARAVGTSLLELLSNEDA